MNILPIPPHRGFAFNEHELRGAVALPNAMEALPVIAAVASNTKLLSLAPFADTGIIVLLHLRPTIVAMVNAWIGFGVDPRHIMVVAKSYRYPEGDLVRAHLKAAGVQIVAVDALGGAVPAFLACLGGKRVIVVEDGGHVLPHLHDYPRLVGAIEQTTKGVQRTKDYVACLQQPYLSLPSSQFKRRFEPSHVARAAITAIEAALTGHARLDTLNVAVIGAAGTIGVAIAETLQPRVHDLVTFDIREPKDFQLLAQGRFRVAASVRDAIAGADLVVGSTGQPIFRGRDLHALKDGAVLASTGSERTEFPLPLIESLSVGSEPFRPTGLGAAVGIVHTLRLSGKKLVILNDGEPMNFGPNAPAEPAVFDLIMAAILVGSVELALGRYDGQVGLLDVFDGIVDRHQLDELFLALHPGTEV